MLSRSYRGSRLAPGKRYGGGFIQGGSANSLEGGVSASIIVVDDEPDVAELFRQRFRREARQGTYVMHFAVSGEEALELLNGEIEPGVIVILSDINMPGMDGLQLRGEIKERFPDLPVMMVTAYGDDATSAGGDGWRGRVSHETGRL
jgi:CheY-like chemotaxis protein